MDYPHFLPVNVGRAIAQAVSHCLPTAPARVHTRVWLSGICGGQSVAGVGFLRVLRFLLPIFIAPNSPSSQSPGACAIGQKWPTCRVWTPLPPPPHYANLKFFCRKMVNIFLRLRLLLSIYCPIRSHKSIIRRNIK
jgi:hypothetical protein